MVWWTDLRWRAARSDWEIDLDACQDQRFIRSIVEFYGGTLLGGKSPWRVKDGNAVKLIHAFLLEDDARLTAVRELLLNMYRVCRPKTDRRQASIPSPSIISAMSCVRRRNAYRNCLKCMYYIKTTKNGRIWDVFSKIRLFCNAGARLFDRCKISRRGRRAWGTAEAGERTMLCGCKIYAGF